MPEQLKTQKHSKQLLNTTQAAEVLGVDRRTLQSWRLREFGPRFMRMSPALVRYRRADLEEWLESLTVDPTDAVEGRDHV